MDDTVVSMPTDYQRRWPRLAAVGDRARDYLGPIGPTVAFLLALVAGYLDGCLAAPDGKARPMQTCEGADAGGPCQVRVRVGDISPAVARVCSSGA